MSALLAVLCLGAESICRWGLHWGSPYDYPLLHTYYMKVHRQIIFPDFHVFFDKFHFFHSKQFYTETIQLSYPAPALLIYKVFLIPLPHPNAGAGAVARFGLSLLVGMLLLLFCWWRVLVELGLTRRLALAYIVGTTVLSFPLWFELAQGNIEWVLWLMLTAAVLALCRGHIKTAAVLIGLAGSAKLFPIIYIGLFIPGRRYAGVGIVMLTACLSTVISLWLVCPDIPYSWHQTVLALTSFERHYMAGVRPLEVGFDHSLFAIVKLALTASGSMPNPQKTLGVYLVTVACGGVVLFFLRIRRMPVINQVFCLAIAAILLPPVSYDYTLLHLYIGVALLSLFALYRGHVFPGVRAPGLVITFLVLAFVLSPESEIIWHGVRYAGQAKAVALLVLGYLCLRWPFYLPGLEKRRPELPGRVEET